MSRPIQYLTLALLSMSLSGAATADDAGQGEKQEPGSKSAAAGLDPVPATPDDLKKYKLMPLPKLPPRSEGSLKRLQDFSPEQIGKGFGTVKKSSKDGRVDRMPVSPRVKDAVIDFYKKSSPKEQKKNIGVPSRGTAEESRKDKHKGLVDETIFGVDDRTRISNTKRYPFRAIGLLGTDWSNGKQSACSATMIDDYNVLTAAHCVWDTAGGTGFADRVAFYPGRNGRRAPYGSYEADFWLIPSGFTEGPKIGYFWDRLIYDIAVVRLRRAAGQQVGYLSYGYNYNLPPFDVNIVGYPVDKKPTFTMWRASCPVNPNQSPRSVLETRCDTWPGSSGAAMYDYESDPVSRIIYGVNVAGSEESNTGVRITKQYFEWIQENTRQ